MRRLVFTVGRGKPKFGEMALGLGRSLSLIGDMNPRAVLTDLAGFSWSSVFHQVIAPPKPRSALDKMDALDLTDAEAVLAIDGDCLAFRKLDRVFEVCRGLDFAVFGFWQTEGTWHGADVAEMCRRYGVERMPKFNGGMLYYERNPRTQALFARMRQLEAEYGNTGFEEFRGNASEEVCVALAMLQTGIGTVVDDDHDFMNTGVGLVGKLRLDVMRGHCGYLCRRDKVRYVEPYVFHASRFSNNTIYWKQLDRLQWLADYEAKHPYGYISPLGKLQRSIERRWLKHVLRKL